MPLMWSTSANDEVWVDEVPDEDDFICAECGEMFWGYGNWDGPNPFCDDCYYEVFGD